MNERKPTHLKSVGDSQTYSEPPIEKGGGPPHDVSMEARVATLEAIIPTLATKADVADLRSEVHKGFADVVKWVVGTGIVGIALALTIMTFVLNNAVPKNVQPVVAPAPIVIQVPAPVPYQQVPAPSPPPQQR